MTNDTDLATDPLKHYSRLARLCFTKGDHIKAQHDHSTARLWISSKSMHTALAGRAAIIVPEPFLNGKKPTAAVMQKEAFESREWRAHVDIRYSDPDIEETLKRAKIPEGATWHFGPAEGLFAEQQQIETDLWPPARPDDAMHVYSARCSWHGDISQAGKMGLHNGHGGAIPCCPHCGSPLFQMDEKTWREHTEAHAKQAKKEYWPDFVEWLTDCGKCWLNQARAEREYLETIAGILNGVTNRTAITIRLTEPGELMVAAMTDPTTGRTAGAIFIHDSRSDWQNLISTPACFPDEHSARMHMRRVIREIRKKPMVSQT